MNHATLNLLEGIVRTLDILVTHSDVPREHLRGLNLKGKFQSVKSELARESEQPERPIGTVDAVDASGHAFDLKTAPKELKAPVRTCPLHGPYSAWSDTRCPVCRESDMYVVIGTQDGKVLLCEVHDDYLPAQKSHTHALEQFGPDNATLVGCRLNKSGWPEQETD